jgi:hypothetical protein
MISRARRAESAAALARENELRAYREDGPG